MDSTFKFLSTIFCTAYGAVIGLMLSAILLVVSIGIYIPIWAFWLSFALPTIVGFILGIYDSRRNNV